MAGEQGGHGAPSSKAVCARLVSSCGWAKLGAACSPGRHAANSGPNALPLKLIWV